jgi:hypothetical protein
MVNSIEHIWPREIETRSLSTQSYNQSSLILTLRGFESLGVAIRCPSGGPRRGRHRMSAAIPITRLDRTASELRGFARRCNDGVRVRRVLAIALVLDGRSRAEAAKQNGMDRQTLSDWVHRYNATGIEGLKSYHPPCWRIWASNISRRIRPRRLAARSVCSRRCRTACQRNWRWRASRR